MIGNMQKMASLEARIRLLEVQQTKLLESNAKKDAAIKTLFSRLDDLLDLHEVAADTIGIHNRTLHDLAEKAGVRLDWERKTH